MARAWAAPVCALRGTDPGARPCAEVLGHLKFCRAVFRRWRRHRKAAHERAHATRRTGGPALHPGPRPWDLSPPVQPTLAAARGPAPQNVCPTPAPAQGRPVGRRAPGDPWWVWRPAPRVVGGARAAPAVGSAVRRAIRAAAGGCLASRATHGGFRCSGCCAGWVHGGPGAAAMGPACVRVLPGPSPASLLVAVPGQPARMLKAPPVLIDVGPDAPSGKRGTGAPGAAHIVVRSRLRPPLPWVGETVHIRPPGPVRRVPALRHPHLPAPLRLDEGPAVGPPVAGHPLARREGSCPGTAHPAALPRRGGRLPAGDLRPPAHGLRRHRRSAAPHDLPGLSRGLPRRPGGSLPRHARRGRTLPGQRGPQGFPRGALQGLAHPLRPAHLRAGDRSRKIQRP